MTNFAEFFIPLYCPPTHSCGVGTVPTARWGRNVCTGITAWVTSAKLWTSRDSSTPRRSGFCAAGPPPGYLHMFNVNPGPGSRDFGECGYGYRCRFRSRLKIRVPVPTYLPTVCRYLPNGNCGPKITIFSDTYWIMLDLHLKGTVSWDFFAPVFPQSAHSGPIRDALGYWVIVFLNNSPGLRKLGSRQKILGLGNFFKHKSNVFV